MYRIKKVFQIIRVLFILPGINWKDEKFQKDLSRWKSLLNISNRDWVALAQMLWDTPEFRNLLIYRNRFRRIYRTWISIIYPPMNTLYIQAKEIGGGLYIQHGFATMIAAESIGENCWINQQVTIGYNGHGRAPIIGDNVMITCGAKVLGSITVGNNVIVGANAVVVKNIYDNTTVGGVPARKIN